MISTKIIQSGIILRNSAIASLQKQVDQTPTVTCVKRVCRGKTRHYVRVSYVERGKRKRVEFSVSSPRGQKSLVFRQKNRLLKEALSCLLNDQSGLKRLLRGGMDTLHETDDWAKALVWQLDPLGATESAQPSLPLPEPYDAANAPHSQFTFSYEEWLALEEANDQSIKNGYRHGRHLFRSKSELLIAKLLEYIGLEYKYEPYIPMGEEQWKPDFAVFCPETGRYFFIEHLGMMDKAHYRIDNTEKIAMYEEAGLRNGIDIIYTTEFARGNFDLDAVFGKITGAVLAQSRLLQGVSAA